MAMSNDELPEGWTSAPFSEVTVEPAQRVPGATEQITYIDIGSVDRDTKKVTQPQTMVGKDAPSRARKVIKTGDVLVSTVRPNLNAVALVDSQYDGQFASTGFDVLRSSVLDPRWAFFAVRTPEFVERMTELVQGALYPAVRSKDVRAFVIPIAPLAEQKRIADKLEAVLGRVAACRARLDRVPDLLKRFRQAVLAAATSGQLTEEWRKESGAQTQLEHPFASAEAPDGSAELPQSWQWVSVGTLATKVTDGVHKKPHYVEDGVPFLTVKSLTAGRGISFEVNNFISTEDHQEFTKRTLPEKDDILVTKDGTLGVVRLIDTDRVFSIFVSLALIKLRDRRMSHYVTYALKSAVVQKQMVGVGTGLQHIHLRDLREDLIPVPPLAEQQESVRRVEALFAFADRIEARLTEARAQVERLTPATLAKAFRGELVPQDPNDEPASALLARIRGSTAIEPAGSRKGVAVGELRGPEPCSPTSL